MVIDTFVVRRARVAKGLLIHELAQRAGISRTSASRACAKGACGIIVARSIANVLGLRLSEIVKDYGPKTIEGEPAR